MLPRLLHRTHSTAKELQPSAHVSARLLEAARGDAAQAIERLESSPAGLSDEEAALRLLRHGKNVIARSSGNRRMRTFVRACMNPLVLLLGTLALVSGLTGDIRSTVVMGIMITIGVALRFVQESRATTAAEALRAMIRVEATVLRGGVSKEIPLSDIVPGDLVELSAGDMVPADVRILHCRDLFVTQGSLTGESYPVEKFEAAGKGGERVPFEIANLGFLGTAVQSGAATALVVETGDRTYFGAVAGTLATRAAPTSFDRGIARFTWLMISFVAVMVPLIFVINLLTKHDWSEAFFFAIAVGVGLTPEMLPMIVSVCLARGAMSMSRHRVIVKRLDSIQNLGAMDVLCADKTGTLTQDRVVLERYCDIHGARSSTALVLAYLNSHFQTGLKSPLDQAVLEHHHVHSEISIADWRKLDEVPFDFSRRLMSVVVEDPGKKCRLICKGAVEEVFRRSTRYDEHGSTLPLVAEAARAAHEEYEQLSSDGFRVLAVAYRDLEPRAAYSKDDESDLTFAGFVAFLDPLKESAASAVAALEALGISVKILTGDNEIVSRKICRSVGLPIGDVALGEAVEQMTSAELSVAVERSTLFAQMTPSAKQRVLEALQRRGHVVGFLGDGINDAPALHTADVGISVDTAVDIAREAADIVLLEKSLTVVANGVSEGRRVFANILKYVRMGASSNFGNMLSVVGASAFLPFLPMAPLQILVNNLLYDISQLPIPTDNADPEQVAEPHPWSVGEISRFIVFIGPCSSVFDYTTFFLMLTVFGCWDPSRAALFHTGWFVESLLTQTLIIHVIRTNRIPLLESRACNALIVTTLGVMLIGIWLPSSPIAPQLGFTPLPPLYWLFLLATLSAYVVLTQLVKSALRRWRWI